MTDAAQHSQPIEDASVNDAAATRLAVRMALGGFALMFVAGAFMWVEIRAHDLRRSGDRRRQLPLTRAIVVRVP